MVGSPSVSRSLTHSNSRIFSRTSFSPTSMVIRGGAGHRVREGRLNRYRRTQRDRLQQRLRLPARVNTARVRWWSRRQSLYSRALEVVNELQRLRGEHPTV